MQDAYAHIKDIAKRAQRRPCEQVKHNFDHNQYNDDPFGDDRVILVLFNLVKLTNHFKDRLTR
jgi:hypothetical protein